jgi:UDP-N-acetyl-2-amino-2-deoxyglucuronate dehydrogenase
VTAGEQLGVVVVGAGVIGQNHAVAIRRHPRLRLVAVADPDPAARRRLADRLAREAATEPPDAGPPAGVGSPAEFGPPAGVGSPAEFGPPAGVGSPAEFSPPAEFGSLAGALAAGGVDLVSVCTPSGLHADAAEQALAAGRHVLVEKPLEVSLPRARRLVELAAEAARRGVVASVVSQHRFDPASVAVANAVAAGRFGRITSAVGSVAWWRGPEYYASAAWRGTWALDGGGALMNQGVHTVDLLLWLLGRPVEVFAHTARLAHEAIEVEDVAVATVLFASGALAVLHATTAAYPGLSVRVQVHGSAGSAAIHDDQLEYFHAAGDGSGATGGPLGGAEPDNQAARVLPAGELRGSPKPADAFVLGHLRQYRDVVEAIDNHRPPGVTVADGLAALAVVHAVYLSATLGRPVTLAEVLEGRLDELVEANGGEERYR